jgi:transposase
VGAPKLGMMAERRSMDMVKRKRQVHTRAFKEQAVALATGSDRPLAAVAKGLGVAPGTLAYWIAHPPADRAAARASSAAARAAALADERTGDPVALRLQLDEARERIRVLEMEQDILKKATAFFARGSL